MRDYILEVKANAERDLLLAQAKVEVAREILELCDRHSAQDNLPCEATEGAFENESVETENIDGELNAV